MKKTLDRFGMTDAKPGLSLLANHFKISSYLCPKLDDDKAQMAKIPYGSLVGSIMYAMICSRPDIVHVVSVISRFMYNLREKHWQPTKYVLRYLKETSNCPKMNKVKRLGMLM